MTSPRLAPVAPRVYSTETGETVRLTDILAPLVGQGQRGIVVLNGPPRSGRTTALAHVAAFFAETGNVELVDDPPADYVRPEDPRKLLLTTGYFGNWEIPWQYQLAPWTRDEAIEYLLATHKDRCGEIFGRYIDQDHDWLLKGNPELCVRVLDILAADTTLGGCRSALWQLARQLLATEKRKSPANDLGLAAVQDRVSQRRNLRIGLLQHDIVHLYLAADFLANHLELLSILPEPPSGPDPDFVAALAEVIGSVPQKVDRLRQWIDSADSDSKAHDALTASVLHAIDPSWPKYASDLLTANDRVLCLRFSRLCGCSIVSLPTPAIDLTDADLSESHLAGLNLQGANLCRANLRNAILPGVRLTECAAPQADFSDADLTDVVALEGNFVAARFHKADLRRGNWTGSTFYLANLTNANAAAGNFSGVNFFNATLKNTSFRGAILIGTNFQKLDLRTVDFTDANLSQADLREALLERIDLPGGRFCSANLTAADLTASRMPGADLSTANLQSAGLAHIEWPGANLSGADLTHASFHLGSTRSGLVNSTIACEGSKTGFYTDESLDQTYRAPEEIRCANLRGADLRGAKVMQTDFYLVDLRDAHYTPQQADHFHRCRAIL